MIFNKLSHKRETCLDDDFDFRLIKIETETSDGFKAEEDDKIAFDWSSNKSLNMKSKINIRVIDFNANQTFLSSGSIKYCRSIELLKRTFSQCRTQNRRHFGALETVRERPTETSVLREGLHHQTSQRDDCRL
jgi:hypothetical protein